MELYSLPSVTIPPYSVAILNVLRHKSGTGKRKNPGKSTIPRVTEMAECPRKDSKSISELQGNGHIVENSVLPAQTFSEKQIEIDAERQLQQLAEIWPQLTSETRTKMLAFAVASIASKRGAQ